MHHVDFIVRDCGSVGFLPIINAEKSGETFNLYRGEHFPTLAQAQDKLGEVWHDGSVSNVRAWKNNPETY